MFRATTCPSSGENTVPMRHMLFVTIYRFRGRDPVRTKIVIDNKIIEKVHSFNYLGNTISYEKELDIYNKLHSYLKITGILNNVLGHK
jgi:hypothetical protein